MDGKAFGAEVVDIVKSYMDRSLADLTKRIDALDAKLAAMPIPKDGEDADPKVVADIVAKGIALDIDQLREAINAIPPAPELPDVEGMVRDAVEALPKPEDGKSVTAEDVAPLIAAEVAKALDAMPKPKDGCGIKELLIDRDGSLVATMDDGRMKSLGKVVGRDGVDADMAALERSITEKVAAIPKPRDGFSLEDFDAGLHEDGRTVLLSFTQGETKHTFELGFPTMIYRNVYKDGSEYQRGDCVTWGGSVWHSEKDGNTDKPGEGSDSWKLAVKKGRDGKPSDAPKVKAG